MTLLSKWIETTNLEIAGRESEPFDRFIQLYFILNNLLKAVYRDENLELSSSDTSIIKETMPTIIESHWNRIRTSESIKNYANDVLMGMQNYISTAIKFSFYADSGTKNKLIKTFTELIPVGHFDTPERITHHSFTKNDFESFSKIVSYSDFKKSECKNLFEGTLSTVYAIRNNFYHGGKSKTENQDKLLRALNFVLIKVIHFLFEVRTILHNSNYDSEKTALRLVEQEYNTLLKMRIIERLKDIYKKGDSDLNQWMHLCRGSNRSYLNFAYYFVMLERLHSILELGLYRKFRSVIEGLECLTTFQEEDIMDISLEAMRNTYENCKRLRNDIFHGNDQINLSRNLREMSRTMDELIEDVKHIIRAVLNSKNDSC